MYGTWTKGAGWHDGLFDVLTDIGFKQSKADPEVWMRPTIDGTVYEYIAVYVGDLAIATRNPAQFFEN